MGRTIEVTAKTIAVGAVERSNGKASQREFVSLGIGTSIARWTGIKGYALPREPVTKKTLGLTATTAILVHTFQQRSSVNTRVFWHETQTCGLKSRFRWSTLYRKCALAKGPNSLKKCESVLWVSATMEGIAASIFRVGEDTRHSEGRDQHE
jgi:hypothetical protein